MRKDPFAGERRFRPQTTRDVAYERVKWAIIEGRLKPGERLVESELAELLDISRTPLREALVQLDREGFVKRVAHRGAFVAEVTVAEMEHLSSVRVALEGLAARTVAEKLAANELESTELTRLDNICEQMTTCLETGDVAGHLQLGRQFHEHIWQLSDNELCTAMLRQVVDAVERYRHLAPQPRMKGVIEDHRKLADVLRRGAAAEAEALMRSHLRDAGSYYARAIETLSSRGGGVEED